MDGILRTLYIALVKRLKLKLEFHPQCYTLGCLNDKLEMIFAHLCLLWIDFRHVFDIVFHDVIQMELTDALMMHSWLYDLYVTRYPRANTYVINVDEKLS